jgi:hypothetical protein
MSLEDMSRKAKRNSKRRDARLAKKGTTAKEEQIKTNEEIQRRTAAQSLSAAQQKAVEAPSIKEVNKGLDGGEASEEVRNDSGRGTHIEHPPLACKGTVSNHEGDRPCRARFFSLEKHAAHMAEVHPENPVPNPTLFKD